MHGRLVERNGGRLFDIVNGNMQKTRLGMIIGFLARTPIFFGIFFFEMVGQ